MAARVGFSEATPAGLIKDALTIETVSTLEGLL
jgi:hypothetical protein